MDDRSNRATHQPASENPADRRQAPRLRAEEVPWIVTVRLRYGDEARLVDISRTGLLIETTARLHPGQKGVMTLGLADKRLTHIESQIVRSKLVSISHEAVPLYQAAVLFTKELEAKLLAPATAEADSAESSVGLWMHHLDGPFEGLWATERGSELARITSLSETGCVTRVEAASVEPGELAAVTIFFTPVRRLLLTGRVTDVRSDGGCVIRFEGLSAEQRRALRVELSSHTARWTSSSSRSTDAPMFTITGGLSETIVLTAGLQASNW